MRIILPTALWTWLVGAASAFAQINDETVLPGNVEPLPTSQPILEYVVAGVFLLAALAIGFKPSKRTHEGPSVGRGGPL